MDEQSLGNRIEVNHAPAELVPVISRLNGLIARLQAAFGRERTFSSDIAHELRTPIAGIRATLEVAISRPRDSEEYRSAIDECCAICCETQRMVETLLSLGRVEAGREQVETRLVDPESVVARSWAPFGPRAAQRNIDARFDSERPVFINTDPVKLQVVLSNLFDNAVSYTNADGWIEVSSSPVEGDLEIVVTNSGCTLTSAEVAQVFDRFWRASESRADSRQHAGLGLALSHRICRLLGAELTVSAVGGTFRAAVRFASRLVESEFMEELHAGSDHESTSEHSKPARSA